MYDCLNHKKSIAFLQGAEMTYGVAEKFRDLPCARWFLAAYVRCVVTPWRNQSNHLFDIWKGYQDGFHQKD